MGVQRERQARADTGVVTGREKERPSRCVWGSSFTACRAAGGAGQAGVIHRSSRHTRMHRLRHAAADPGAGPLLCQHPSCRALSAALASVSRSSQQHACHLRQQRLALVHQARQVGALRRLVPLQPPHAVVFEQRVGALRPQAPGWGTIGTPGALRHMCTTGPRAAQPPHPSLPTRL